MRKVIQWTAVPAVLIVAACSKGKTPTTSMTEDLKRDLKLASVTQNLQISPDEVAPKSHQEMAVKPKKAPDGPKVVRTEHPTVKASATPTQVAEIKTDIPQVQVMASAPAPSETPSSDAPPLARPSPVPASSYPGAAAIPSNGGSGGILGGIFGAVIRGGGVGDDDHCDPRGAHRGGHPIGGDVNGVYGGGMGGIGGMGLARACRPYAHASRADKRPLNDHPPLVAGNTAPVDFGRAAPCFVGDRPRRPSSRTSDPEVLSAPAIALYHFGMRIQHLIGAVLSAATLAACSAHDSYVASDRSRSRRPGVLGLIQR